ncbi:hypothetical protein O9992_00060 [Vibrio lentus]|nr:hypothetical protein [Vibrio lentus]
MPAATDVDGTVESCHWKPADDVTEGIDVPTMTAATRSPQAATSMDLPRVKIETTFTYTATDNDTGVSEPKTSSPLP